MAVTLKSGERAHLRFRLQSFGQCPLFAIHQETSEWQPHCSDLGVISVIKTKENAMRDLWSRVSIGWCQTFHPKPFWPTHGHYDCPACLRSYPVPWQEGTDFARRKFSETHPSWAASRGSCLEWRPEARG